MSTQPPAAADHPAILQGLQEVAAAHLNFVGTLQPEASLAEEVAQDSLARLTLVVEVENKFRTCITDEEAMALRTVADVVQLLANKGATPPAPA